MDYMEVMDYGVPNYYALMLVTGEDQLEANRDKYTRFLRACQKGFADMQADPEEALGLLLANQDEENFPLTESVERRSFDVLLPIMETADAPFLSQDVSVWQENIDWLQKVGMIDAAFDPAEVMGGPAGGVRHGRWRMPRDRHCPVVRAGAEEMLPRQLALLEQICAIDSGTGNEAGNAAVTGLLEPVLSELGARTER